eukprot:Skav234608  [mRNA]  locus=scaffold1110:311523:319907:- [translate_table: standard]
MLQAVCVNLGYTVPENIKEAVNKQLETMPYLQPSWKRYECRQPHGRRQAVKDTLVVPRHQQSKTMSRETRAHDEAVLTEQELTPWPVKRLMAEICPGDLNGFLFPSGGGEANEAAIRMARLYTGKQKIFTQYRSYHGGCTSSLGATGDFRRRFAESNTHGFSWGNTDQSATERTLACLEDCPGPELLVVARSMCCW